MPITGTTSYPSVINSFLQHWEDASGQLAPAVLTIVGGKTRADLDTERGTLEGRRDAVTDSQIERGLQRALLNGRIAGLQARVVEFNERVRADLPGSAYARVLPDAFAIGDGEQAVRDCLRAILKVWDLINTMPVPPAGIALPLILRESYPVADFDAQRVELRTAYKELADLDVQLNFYRARRNEQQDLIYEMLKNYRLKVAASFAPAHPIVATLPALTPPDGHTPAPVAAQAVWDVPGTQAKVTWEASADPDLVSYQIRGVPGDEYDSNDEVLVATVDPADPREVLTDFALNTPGITAGFKVYVVLDTGREAGSVARFVTRPV